MAISGLNLLLSHDENQARAALDAITRDSRLTLGPRFGRRIALVAETSGADADADLWRDLHAAPGVVSVEVTFISVDAGRETGPDAQPAGSN